VDVTGWGEALHAAGGIRADPVFGESDDATGCLKINRKELFFLSKWGRTHVEHLDAKTVALADALVDVLRMPFLSTQPLWRKRAEEALLAISSKLEEEEEA
jgi:hypothetical protein